MNKSKITRFLLVFLSVLISIFISNALLSVKPVYAAFPPGVIDPLGGTRWWCGATYCCTEFRDTLNAINWPGGTVRFYCHGDSNGYCVDQSRTISPGQLFDMNRCSCRNGIDKDGESCLHHDPLPANCSITYTTPICGGNGAIINPAPLISCIAPQVSLSQQCSDTSSTVRLTANWNVAGNSCTVNLIGGASVYTFPSNSCSGSWNGTSFPSPSFPFATGNIIKLEVKYSNGTLAGEQTVNIDCTRPEITSIVPNCLGGGDISWTNTGDASYIVDISTKNPPTWAVNDFYNKTVNGATSTSFPSGFSLYPAGAPALAPLPVGSTNVARIYSPSKNLHSSNQSFTIPVCAPTPTPTPTPTPIIYTYTIEGKVYIDADNSGTYNPPTDQLYTSPYIIQATSGGIPVVPITYNNLTGKYNITMNSINNSLIVSVTLVPIPSYLRVPTSQDVTVNSVTPTSLGNDFRLILDAVNTINGTVYTDNTGGACMFSSAVYTTGGADTNLSGLTGLNRNSAVNGAGNYSFTALPNDRYMLSLIPPSGYFAVSKQITENSNPAGPWETSSPSSEQIEYIDETSPQTTRVDFCMSNVSPWYQTVSGDVRMPRIQNSLPAGKFASEQSVFFSSGNIASPDFGSGKPVEFASCSADSNCWVVPREYQYNRLFERSQGVVSYSYYYSKADQFNISKTTLKNALPVGDCDNPDFSCKISNLSTGVYTVGTPSSPENLTIDGYTHNPLGAHVVILVSGNVTIKATASSNHVGIRVPSGSSNLFILAAKGDIEINGESDPVTGIAYARAVGTSSYASSETQLDGIYTAEGDIIIGGKGSSGCAATLEPDLQLKVGGSFVANADYPFLSTNTVGDANPGEIKNGRSLCAGNIAEPALKIIFRNDFIYQLTDYYKESDSVWTEVEP